MVPPTDDDDFYVKVGERLRVLRKARGLSMQDVVEGGYVGAQAHLSHLERGQVKPSLQTLVRLAECFGVHVRELLPEPPLDRAAILGRVSALSDAELSTLAALLQLVEGSEQG